MIQLSNTAITSFRRLCARAARASDHAIARELRAAIDGAEDVTARWPLAMAASKADRVLRLAGLTTDQGEQIALLLAQHEIQPDCLVGLAMMPLHRWSRIGEPEGAAAARAAGYARRHATGGARHG